jgi:hypothetical protein
VAWRFDGTDWHLADLPGDGAGRRVTAVVPLPDGGFVAVGAVNGLGDVTGPLGWRATVDGAWRTVGASSADQGGFVDVDLDVGGRVVAWGNGQEGKRSTPELHELRGDVFVPIDG